MMPSFDGNLLTQWQEICSQETRVWRLGLQRLGGLRAKGVQGQIPSGGVVAKPQQAKL